MGYDAQEVKEALSIDDIYSILDSLGGEPEMIDDEYIIARTICHGGDSRKLYYYANNSMFNCYTSCGSFDIFELIMKIHHLDFNTAINYVVDFFNLGWKLDTVEVPDNTKDWDTLKRYEKIADIQIADEQIILPEISKELLKYYPQPNIADWEQEGISKAMMDFYDIKYDPVDQSILIPHTDENNRLIGIRRRTLLPQQEKFGKYRPAYINGKLYNHPLGFNLYGLYHAKDNIKKIHKAIVVEGEKSVLKIGEYLGLQNTIGVAVCGSNLTKYQLQLLIDAGANEIIIAFDADYEEFGDEDCLKVIEHLQSIHNKYNGYATISFMFDNTGEILSHKMSPVDAGKEAFLQLWRNRVVL